MWHVDTLVVSLLLRVSEEEPVLETDDVASAVTDAVVQIDGVALRTPEDDAVWVNPEEADRTSEDVTDADVTSDPEIDGDVE